MSQVLTPEEMAALFEGLREAEDGPGSLYYYPPQETTAKGPVLPYPPQETTAKGPVLPEPVRINRSHNLSTWLMVLADLRWPHL